MRRKAVDNSELQHWRTLSITEALPAIVDYGKIDGTFRPLKSAASIRWHATVEDFYFEILCTGPKFWDTRGKVGGCGAVDLAMYLLSVDFTRVVAILRTKGL
ncbi:TPA: hypothetical protein QDB02_006061 [Burkholderia vietnamiensis]|uniref:hypothetical protein n=1 Tax=Burkholderia vietnamiensis TaxID=60552 RepID=UPI001B92CE48|nr:hypothetical protein [Burkholderia vietnamiensis]MBR8036732.1 hypothetical protein [Burkholderia vietnamiensis]HDR9058244.1 hypothetical protein [Burkholderia vietnamiensis]